MKRVCIYPKDVVRITGVSIRKAQKILRDIRFVLKKEKHQYITRKEFSEYTGIDDDLLDV